jgi:hypothetical protein
LACGGTACRHGGPRLALLVPDTDAEAMEELAVRLAEQLPEAAAARLAFALWSPGDTGAQVVERARAALRGGDGARAAAAAPPMRNWGR